MFKCSCQRMKCDRRVDACMEQNGSKRLCISIFLSSVGQRVSLKIHMVLRNVC